MCGIVGYVGHTDRAQEVILGGLRRLEYRGYDSAGIAILADGKLRIVRSVGKLVNLERELADRPTLGSIGIGHTRWATHGRPSEQNAHPHSAGTVALIHNGIVENHRALREELAQGGSAFSSDTDSEIIVHLIARERSRGRDLLESVKRAVADLVGAFAITVIDEEEPDRIVAAKDGGSPVVIGLGDDETFIASDIPAILPYTRRVIALEDGEVALVERGGVQIFGASGAAVTRSPRIIQWDPIQAEKGGYERFMEKEIHEQPRAIGQTLGSRVLEEPGDIDLDGIQLDPAWVQGLHGVQLLGCGTASYAARVGSYLIERFAKIPAHLELASEFRYRGPLIGENHLAVAVSQSGETADTLGALRKARELGATTLAITNTHESTIARESRHVLYTHAGPEIGVASTKCFTTQVVVLHLLALKLGLWRGALDHDAVRQQIVELRRLPRLVEETLLVWDRAGEIARELFRKSNFLFLGRGVGYPVALEGALKLKEISYIHAEGYASGEMKHGPIALIDENTPVVVVANQVSARPKVLSNAEEVRARGGIVIAILEEGDEEGAALADHVIFVPAAPEALSAVVATIPLQILAYQIATMKGTDVDQPRNLAKSVTVE